MQKTCVPDKPLKLNLEFTYENRYETGVILLPYIPRYIHSLQTIGSLLGTHKNNKLNLGLSTKSYRPISGRVLFAKRFLPIIFGQNSIWR